MAEKMEFTGERFTPECEREIWYEHVHRYAFASTMCRGARVLDAACGEGYGSAMLAEAADHVVGVDVSDDAIRHAKSRYEGQGAVEFQVADCTDLPFGADEFDRIVSFETIEHLSGQADMLAEFRRVLRPEGVLILSSPDRGEYSDRRGFDNPHHVKELYRDELESLVFGQFPACRILGQKLLFHSVIFDTDGADRVTLQTDKGTGELECGSVPHAPMYFIALCAASEELLPNTGSRIWMFDDHAESVYQHYNHEIRKNMEAGGILRRLESRVEELEAERDRAPWWRRWMKRG
jgi:SAM-dependent methyltransferase